MKQNIVIIGAGVSGLVAAIELESKGYAPIIFEANDRVGGRVQSEIVGDYILDEGFQVLLSAYPMVKKYLDLDKLSSTAFEPGSYIYENDKKHTIGDPTRNISFALPTLTASIGSLLDKFKIYTLSKRLKQKKISDIFEAKEITTIQYLKKYGFSNQIIESFFRPFFAGIFLETELKTSSRMFEFIFKMFAEGEALLPNEGIQAIPNQLAAKLKSTVFHFKAKVKQVQGDMLVLENRKTQVFDACIIASEVSNLMPNLKQQQVWKSTQTLYFEVVKPNFKKQLIGLFSFSEKALINSISFLNTKLPTAKNHLLSVSIVKKHSFSEKELQQKVEEELWRYLQLKTIQHLKTVRVNKALPVLNNVQYGIAPSETQLTEKVFLAGDTMLNGSLNAAMLAGELAAKGVHQKITGNILG